MIESLYISTQVSTHVLYSGALGFLRKYETPDIAHVSRVNSTQTNTPEHAPISPESLLIAFCPTILTTAFGAVFANCLRVGTIISAPRRKKYNF